MWFCYNRLIALILVWVSNPIHTHNSCVVTSTALLPWMDYPYMQCIFHTFRGLHGLKLWYIEKFFTFQAKLRTNPKLVIYAAVAVFFHIPIHGLRALLFWGGMDNPLYNKPMFCHSLVIFSIYIFQGTIFLLKFTDELLRIYQFPRMGKGKIFVDFLHEIW